MGSRRGANEGSVYRRKDGRWVAVLHVGYAAGRRERKAYYGATRQEVASELAAAIRDRQQGKRPVPEREKALGILRAAAVEVEAEACVLRLEIRGITADDVGALIRRFAML